MAPTYGYKCLSCDHEFDVFHGINDEPVTGCPECGRKTSVVREIGPGGAVIFKGSGFYETDYKRKKNGQA